MTRGGFAPYERGVLLSQANPRDFPQTARGVWLPQLDVSINTFYEARHSFERRLAALGGKAHEATLQAGQALNNGEFDYQTGCWRASEQRHTENLWTIATHEMGRVLNPPTQKNDLEICGTSGCLNTRHYDFTFGITTRQALYEPVPTFYKTRPDGTVETIWGDILPSVAHSIASFRLLQAKCPPYASESRSPLTANGISKITIHPVSGCWMVRSYYTNQRGTDSYARLTMPHHLGKKGERTGAQMLAHRVLWLITGHTSNIDKDLNHLCGYRACGNTDHLQETTRSENNQHSRRMQAAISRLNNRS